MNAHDISASHEALYCRIHDYVTAELEGAATAEQRRDFAELVRGEAPLPSRPVREPAAGTAVDGL